MAGLRWLMSPAAGACRRPQARQDPRRRRRLAQPRPRLPGREGPQPPRGLTTSRAQLSTTTAAWP